MACAGKNSETDKRDDRGEVFLSHSSVGKEVLR
jgi:hypothetical protein